MFFLLLCALVGSAALEAQIPPAVLEKPREEPIAVYVDCKDILCDLDYLRTEITFVTYARERQDADVHLLITGQPTAEGGTEVTVNFIGQKEFAGLDDTLRYVTRPGESEDQIRAALAGLLKRGLVQYVNRTMLGQDLTVLYVPSVAPAAALQEDPWNFWSFSASANGFVTGEEVVQSRSFGASLSANRTTEEWKVNASFYTQYNSTTFELGDERSVSSVQRSRAVSGLVVRSVSDHLSIGGRTSLSSSSFLNQSLTARLAPAVEYNLFPYTEANRRMFTIEYSLGLTSFDYEEETLFGKTSEVLFDHRVLASLRLTQPWGSVGVGAEGSHYLHDPGKNRGIIVGNADWNVTKGLSLNTSVNFQRVRDQLFLPGRGISEEEILLRQRQLATSYSYAVSFGVSYRFGSAHANIVNRRFAGSIGGLSLLQ